MRTRDPPAVGNSSGVYCDRDAIPRTWLVHLGSDPLIGFGRAKVGTVNPVSEEHSRIGNRINTAWPASPTC